jgi:putative transposase
MMPHDLPNHNTVYHSHNLWSKAGVWERVNAALVSLERGRNKRFSKRQDDAKKGACGYDGNKKVKGHKRHIATDTDGNLLVCEVTPANRDDRGGMKPVQGQLKQRVPALKKLYVDSGYGSAPFQAWPKTTHDVEVVLRPDAGITLQGFKGFQVVQKRWVVECTFAWLPTFRRLKVDYEERTDISEGFVTEPFIASVTLVMSKTWRPCGGWCLPLRARGLESARAGAGPCAAATENGLGHHRGLHTGVVSSGGPAHSAGSACIAPKWVRCCVPHLHRGMRAVASVSPSGVRV